MSADYKVINENPDTVGKLIEVLKQIPKDYKISLSGMNAFGIAVDNENGAVLLDDVSFIEELTEDIER